MAYPLIKALKTSSLKKRSEAAKALGRDICEKLDKIITETDIRNADWQYISTGYSELVHMAQGERRRGLRWYQYGDALYGIEALAETSAESALELLENWYVPTLKTRGDNVYLDFQNAPKVLRERLSQSTICRTEKGKAYTADTIKQIVREREPHRTFVMVIKKLEDEIDRRKAANLPIHRINA